MSERDKAFRAAKELWSSETLAIAPQEFQERFDDLYRRAIKITTFWQLGGAANDYLRENPDSILVPSELPAKLLECDLIDGRIIGLKLLVRCSSNSEAIGRAICAALNVSDQYELYGGLLELDRFLKRRIGLSPISMKDILVELHRLRASNDPYVRNYATNLAEALEEIMVAN